MIDDDDRAHWQMVAAVEYDAGNMDACRAALAKLGAKSWAEGLAHLIDGGILVKHLGVPSGAGESPTQDPLTPPVTF